MAGSVVMLSSGNTSFLARWEGGSTRGWAWELSARQAEGAAPFAGMSGCLWQALELTASQGQAHSARQRSPDPAG